MYLYPLVLLAALHCSAQDTDAMAMGSNQTEALDDNSPPPCRVCPPVMDMQPLIQDHVQEAEWRGEVVGLLSQLVAGQKEVAGGQSEVAKMLATLGAQGTQQITDLQNVARHQSLLVENHQALLLHISRIAAQLRDMAKKLPN